MRLRPSSRLRWPLLGTVVPVLLAACLPGGRLAEVPTRKGSALRAQPRGSRDADKRAFRVLFAGPEGEGVSEPQVQLMFSKPVRSIGQPRDEPALDARFEPALAGRWEWMSASSVRFVPMEPLKDATQYTLAVGKPPKSLAGETLAEPITLSFSTPRPKIASTSPAPDQDGVRPTDPIEVYLSQAISDDGLRTGLSLVKADGTVVPTRFERPEWDGRRADRARLVPLAPLAEGARYEIKLASGVVGLAGPLASKEERVSFTTQEPLSVDEISCFDHEDGRCRSYSSVTIRLNDEMRPSDLRALLKIDPAVKLDPPNEDDRPTQYHTLIARFATDVPYTFTVGASTSTPRPLLPSKGDSGGPVLLRPMVRGKTATLRFAPPEPGVHFSFRGTYIQPTTAELAARAEETKVAIAGSVPLDRALVMAREIEDAASGDDGAKPTPWWQLPGAKTIPLPARVTRNDPPAWTTLKDLTPALGPVLFGARWDGFAGRPEQSTVTLQRTDLALHARVSPEGTLVWVTSLGAGAPVEGVALEARDVFGGSVQGTTDKDGIALLPTPTLRVERDPKHERWNRREKGFLVVFAQKGDDWIFRRIALPRPAQPEGAVFTDRGLYRPGETVQLKGMVHRPTSRGLVPMVGEEIDVEVSDPNGRVSRSKAKTNEWGTFHLPVATALDAPLGFHGVTLLAGGESVGRGSFAVEEYRPTTMSVSTRLDKSVYVRGEQVTCEVDARYLYGGAVSGGVVQTYLRRYTTRFDVPGLVGYSVADMGFWGTLSSLNEPERTWKLDASGRRRESVTLTNVDQRGPEEVICDVVVTDAAQDRVASTSTALVHPGEVYVALEEPRSGQIYPEQKLALKVLVVTPKGERRKRPVHLELFRASVHPKHEWDTLPPVSVASCEVESGETPKSCPLAVPSDPLGEARGYIVRATTEDSKGTVGASFRLWPAKKPPRPARPTPRRKPAKARPEPPVQKLVLDRETYERGETAHLLATSPFARGHMLFTVEREGILSHRVMPITREPVALDVPIDARTAPFVDAVVTSVAPASDEKSHAHLRGHESTASAKIEAGHDDHKLVVTIKPQKLAAAPGEELDIDVDVRDVEGKPARAELTLYAADEGTLLLARYHLPNPIDGFYGGRESTMLTEDTRDSLGSLFDWQAELRDWARGIRRGNGSGRLGGSHRTKAPSVRMGATAVSPARRNFDQGAFFLPSLVTDEAGHVRAHVKLPEALTAYRVMGFATTKAADVGAAEITVTTSMPLQVRPTLPRTIRAGDRFVVGAMASNNGDKTLAATVTFSSDVLAPTGAAVQRLDLAPGASERVLFEVEAKAPGHGKALVSVTTDDKLADSAELPVDITPPVALETAASYGVAEGRVDEELAELATVRSDVGSLEVSLSSSPLAGLGAGLEQLVHYPYGCTEQTISRLVPLLHLRPLAAALEVKLPDDVPEASAEAVRRVFANQHPDGGFGLWPSSKEAAPWLSVYATWGLSEAARVGVPVDARALANARKYLSDLLAAGDTEPAKRVTAPFALDVLASALDAGKEQRPAGAIDANGLREIARQQLAKREGLPLFARAHLLHALARLGIDGPARDALVAELVAAVHLDGPVARVVKNGELLVEHFDSNARTSALVLRALLAVDPAHPLATPLALGLVQDRHGGTWRSTQETAWALIALDAYRSLAAPATGVVSGEVRLGDRALFGHAFAAAPGTIAPDARSTLPLASLVGASARGDRSLSFIGRGAPVYYQARLRFAPAVLPRDDLAAGFEIHRSYRRVPTGLSEASLRAQTLPSDDTGLFPEGSLVLVELMVTTTSTRRWLVVDDALPGGFEALDADREPVGDGSLNRLVSRGQTRIERRDDRTVFFADKLEPGTVRFAYAVRATIQGRYTAPPARVEEMYTPETFGRTGAREIVVTPRAAEPNP